LSEEKKNMLDLVFILLTCLFFALAISYVRFCEKV
jgi:succinate-acetate transporter protein